MNKIVIWCKSCRKDLYVVDKFNVHTLNSLHCEDCAKGFEEWFG